MTSMKVRSALFRLISLPVTLLAMCAVLFGQTSTGEVNGVVADPSGAAVPAASVRLINLATKIETQATPNQDGYFIFVNVRPGLYALRIAAPGFKITEIPSFDVGVSQTVKQNITLTVGDVSQTVEVNANAELLQSGSTELGTVIQERAVQD